MDSRSVAALIRALMGACALVFLVGCPGFGSQEPGGTLDAVPDRPNFEDHLLPIMNRHCNDCHGDSARQGAPSTFRLDRCEETNKAGAKRYAGRLVVRTLDSPTNPMPPSSYVLPNVADIDGRTLRRWHEIGAPCTAAEAGDSQGGGLFHPDSWFDGSDDEGQRHGLALETGRGQARDPAAETMHCNDARCHGEDLTGGEDANGCDTCHDALDPNPMWRTNCTFCHGSPADGTGAPPRNLDPANTTLSFAPHTIHGNDTAVHVAFPCASCHLEPESVTSPGHVFDDTRGRVEVPFDAALNPDGIWSTETGSCSALYCHGDGQGNNGTIAASEGTRDCASCHKSASSPSAEWEQLSAAHLTHLRENLACVECHADVVGPSAPGDDPEIVEPALHVNGKPDVRLNEEGMTIIGEGAWTLASRCDGVCHNEQHDRRGWFRNHHPAGWTDPDQHGMAAKLNLRTDPSGSRSCNDAACHGVDLRGGLSGVIGCDNCHEGGHETGWREDCVYCHGGDETLGGAPPRDLDGTSTNLSFPPHTSHVEDGDVHGSYACAECHLEPESVTTPGHLFDDTPGSAEVDFAAGISAAARWDGTRCTNVYCHGDGRGDNGTISVTTNRVDCTDCHENQSGQSDNWERMSGEHKKHLEDRVICADCHGDVVNSTLLGGNPTIIAPPRHVDGQVQFRPDDNTLRRQGDRCSGTCHGEEHKNERW